MNPRLRDETGSEMLYDRTESAQLVKGCWPGTLLHSCPTNTTAFPFSTESKTLGMIFKAFLL